MKFTLMFLILLTAFTIQAQEKIVFTMVDLMGYHSIGLMNPDGSELKCLIEDEGNIWDSEKSLHRANVSRPHSPCIAPGGERILFAAGKMGRQHIFSINRNGGDLRMIRFSSKFTDLYTEDTVPSPENISEIRISREGLIAFTGNIPGSKHTAVYIVSLQGKDPKRICGNSQESAFNPNFSYIGANLLVTIATDDGSDIYDITLETGDKVCLTDFPEAHKWNANASVYGSGIVYSDNQGIKYIDRDGSDYKTLVKNYGILSIHASCRNRLIVFSAFDSHDEQIFTSNPDGSDVKKISIKDNSCVQPYFANMNNKATKIWIDTDGDVHDDCPYCEYAYNDPDDGPQYVCNCPDPFNCDCVDCPCCTSGFEHH